MKRRETKSRSTGTRFLKGGNGGNRGSVSALNTKDAKPAKYRGFAPIFAAFAPFVLKRIGVSLPNRHSDFLSVASCKNASPTGSLLSAGCIGVTIFEFRIQPHRFAIRKGG